MVTHARQVFDTAAAHQHHRVLLQVVAFATDVRNDLETVGQAHFGDLTQGRVRLFGGGGVHACAHTASLRAVFERGALALDDGDFARLAHELANGWHNLLFPFISATCVVYDAFAALPFLGSSRKPTIKRKSVKERVLHIKQGHINKPSAVGAPKNCSKPYIVAYEVLTCQDRTGRTPKRAARPDPATATAPIRPKPVATLPPPRVLLRTGSQVGEPPRAPPPRTLPSPCAPGGKPSRFPQESGDQR